MSDDTVNAPATPGIGKSFGERLPMLPMDSLDERQRAAARALIDGPRKGVFGPFVPLLRTPELLDRVATLGEHLRFKTSLDARIRELVTCAASRHVSNQFEWLMHAPLALSAGVSQQTLEAMRVGARPRDLPTDEELALDFTHELLATHGVSDLTYIRVVATFGEKGVVELSTLIGYFVMVSWLMNVARTPPLGNASADPLTAFPQ